MTQRDYVSCGKSSGTQRKKSNSKKQCSSSGTSKTIIVLAAVVLITLIGGFYFINNKFAKVVIVPSLGTHIGNELPPKPEERWRYIKELENRQIGVQIFTESSSGREVNAPVLLTDGQHQLLEQMQADIHHEPTHLNEVPYHNQSKPSVTTTTQQHCINQVPCNPFSQQPVHTSRHNLSVTVALPRQTSLEAQKSYTATTVKEPAKEKLQRWVIQCGSFKGMDQAESVRAQLAFSGIESCITISGGRNRVILGPYSNRAHADKSLQNLSDAGVSNCIPIATRG